MIFTKLALLFIEPTKTTMKPDDDWDVGGTEFVYQ